jgi:hypothetical protein
MKIKNYFLKTVFFLGFIALTSVVSFAQQPQQKKQEQKAKTEQPSWMKSKNYGSDVKNVYFPDQDMYYNVKKEVYIYKADGKWKESKSVPSKYSKVDFAKAKQTKLTKDTTKPQKENSTHKKGSSQKGNSSQKTNSPQSPNKK